MALSHAHDYGDKTSSARLTHEERRTVLHALDFAAVEFRKLAHGLRRQGVHFESAAIAGAMWTANAERAEQLSKKLQGDL